MLYCTYNLLNMFRALICPSSRARDYTCVMIACCSAPNSRPPTTKALHTICGNNTIIVSSCWWWAYNCPKHVEQIISAIKHSVASSWFSSLHLYYDTRTNIRQILILFQQISFYYYNIRRRRLLWMCALKMKFFSSRYFFIISFPFIFQ